MKNNPHKRTAAFSLVELMIASSLAVIVLGAVLTGFTQHRRTFHHKNLEQELQQNVRTAMMFLQRDLRYAASGMTMGFQNLDNWFGLGAGINTIPWIGSDGDGQDDLVIVGITGEPVATLSAWVLEGGNVLDLTIRDSTVLPYTPQTGDVLLLAGIEAVLVNEVLSSTRVRVSRDPMTSGTGVHLVYPVDTEVFQLNVIEYWVDEVDGVPSLLRDDSRFSYESNEDRVIADGIERIELLRNGNIVEINLTGRSRRTLPNVPNDTVGDSRLRYTLSSSNRIRNTSPRLDIQGWPSDMLFADVDGTGNQPPPEEEGNDPEPTPEPDPDADPEPEPTPEPTPSSPGNSGNAPGRGNRPQKGKK
jgi:type II secretory pathway pseudopilin PulG